MANMEQGEENLTVSQVHGLIKQKRNAELKSLLLQGQGVSSSLMDKQESTLMHAAVMFNNIDVIALLFGLGFNINARNSIGQTPLMLAARNNSYQAVQLLLALDADVLVSDNEGANALKVLLQKRKNTPTQFIENLFERLKRSELSSGDIVNELVKAGCPLEHIFMFNDAEITREMLVLIDEKNEDTLRALLKRAMYTMDMANTKVLLEYEPHSRDRRQNFFDEVTKNLFDPVTKPFFEQLVNWKVIDEPHMDYVSKLFRFAGDEHFGGADDHIIEYMHANENDIQMFLDIGIDQYCREKFGHDLLMSLFANETLDIVRLVKDRQFDVNRRDEIGNTLLHVATRKSHVESVSYLLDIGADPNIKNHKGKTPLFFTEECPLQVVELLLEAGADLQAMDEKNRFAFECILLDDIDFLLVKLIIIEYQGLLKKKARTWLYDFRSQKKCNKYIQDLDWMNTRMVSESINLFTVLTEKFDRLALYVKDEKTCAEIRNAVTNERKIQPEYSKMLMRNLNKACKFNELKRKAAKFLCDKMQIGDCDHLVIEKIIGFITYRNLLVFEKMEKD